MDHLSQTFSALADPTRRAMLARLSKGEASVSDLARPFLADMTLPAVTKHLKVLERAGLITKTREAQFRPCRLNGEGLRDAADWMEQYREFWEASLDRLGEYLTTVTAQAKTAPQPSTKAAKTPKSAAKTSNAAAKAGASTTERTTAKTTANKRKSDGRTKAE